MDHLENMDQNDAAKLFLLCRSGSDREIYQLEITSRASDWAAQVNYNSQSGRTPLQYALLYCSLFIITRLLNGRKSDVRKQCAHGNTALHYACHRRSVDAISAIRMVLELAPDLVNICNNSGLYPIHLVIQYQSLQTVQMLCGEYGADAAVPNGRQETPLIIATKRKDWVKVMYLLYGTDCDASYTDNAGYNALCYAMLEEYCCLAIVGELLPFIVPEDRNGNYCGKSVVLPLLLGWGKNLNTVALRYLLTLTYVQNRRNSQRDTVKFLLSLTSRAIPFWDFDVIFLVLFMHDDIKSFADFFPDSKNPTELRVAGSLNVFIVLYGLKQYDYDIYVKVLPTIMQTGVTSQILIQEKECFEQILFISDTFLHTDADIRDFLLSLMPYGVNINEILIWGWYRRFFQALDGPLLKELPTLLNILMPLSTITSLYAFGRLQMHPLNPVQLCSHFAVLNGYWNEWNNIVGRYSSFKYHQDIHKSLNIRLPLPSLYELCKFEVRRLPHLSNDHLVFRKFLNSKLPPSIVKYILFLD